MDLETLPCPGKSWKKHVIIIMLHSYWSNVPLEAEDTLALCLRNCRGMGLIWLGGGSCFIYQYNWNHRRMYRSPWLVIWRSLAPKEVSN